MSVQHDHREPVQGCYRCELSADEIAELTRPYSGRLWTIQEVADELGIDLDEDDDE